MADLVQLEFVNRDKPGPDIKDELTVDRKAAHHIARWYGAYHGGDDYDVLVDGEIVEKDLNGEIAELE